MITKVNGGEMEKKWKKKLYYEQLEQVQIPTSSVLIVSHVLCVLYISCCMHLMSVIVALENTNILLLY